jgi:hypothetical protein
MRPVQSGDYYRVYQADLLISNLRAELEAERAKVGEMANVIEKAKKVIGGTHSLMEMWLLGPEDGLHKEIQESMPYLHRWLAARALPTEEGERA